MFGGALARSTHSKMCGCVLGAQLPLGCWAMSPSLFIPMPFLWIGKNKGLKLQLTDYIHENPPYPPCKGLYLMAVKGQYFNCSASLMPQLSRL
jgi:hypothetical protein